jgi:predicted ABC-type ATPase
MPALFIITGSNGAGKSTVGNTYLPPEIQKDYTSFDGDKLALIKRREFRKTIKADKEAKKLANEWVDKSFNDQVKNALKNNDHFVYEGHFRYEESWAIPRKFKRKNYYLSLVFMGLADPHQSELRVIERAKYGGHNVEQYDIHLNFYGNLEKVNKHYKLFDEMHIIDTSQSLEHKVLLHFRDNKVLSYVPVKELPEWFLKFLPNLLKLVKKEEKQKPVSDE